MGLDYDSKVMLTCKLLLAIAKAIVDVGSAMSAGLFFLQDKEGMGKEAPAPHAPPVSASAVS